MAPQDVAVKVYMSRKLHGDLTREANLRDVALSALIRHALHKEVEESKRQRALYAAVLPGQAELPTKKGE